MRQGFLVILLLVLAESLFGQRFAGYLYSDYSGVLGAKSQPASLADSPYKYDINLLNGNFYVTNNIAFRNKASENAGLVRFINDKEKFLQANLSIGGLSAMLSLPRKQGIALNMSARFHASGNDISPDFIQQFNRFSRPEFIGRTIVDQQLEVAFGAWYEIGLTYAAVIKDNGFNRWKFGITPKLVNGLGAGFARLNDLDYEIDNQLGEVRMTDLHLEFGYSSNLDEFEQFDGTEPFSSPKGIGFKPALDFGVTFERVAFRGDPSESSGTRLDPDITYEFKVSASITDLGIFKYDLGRASTNAPSLLPNPGFLDLEGKFDGLSSFRELADSLATISNTESLGGQFTVTLPTALNLNYDYNLGNYYYFNANVIVDLTRYIPADYRLNHLTNLTLTPRWEKGQRGFYLPVHVNQIGDFQVGMAARLGPLTFGTQNIGSLFSQTPSSGSFFFSINISKLKANSKKPYCFGVNQGSANTTQLRKPLYKRKKWIFF